jgi:hypothetical protein
MSKIAIEKTIAKMGPKQRALLFFNHITALNAGDKGLLSETESNRVFDSFKGEQEIKLYNKYRNIHIASSQFLSSLAQFRFMHMVAIERLDKYIIMLKNNIDTEDMFNIMIELMPDKKTKAKAQKIAKSFTDLSTVRHIKSAKHDEYIEIENKELIRFIEEARAEVDMTQLNLKTSIAAIRDYLSENNFNIKIFLAYIKEVENWAKGEHEKGFTIAVNGRDSKKDVSERLRNIAGKYRTEKPYDEIEINKEQYDSIRNTILKNEKNHE